MPIFPGSTARAGRPLRAVLVALATLVAVLLVGGGLLVRAGQPPAAGAAFIAAGSSQPSTGPGLASQTLADPSPATTEQPRPSASGASTKTPASTPQKPFAMDLYQKGDYVGELEKVWCLPAAMQTSMNIMDPGADTSRATQARIFTMARSIDPAPDGAAEPEACAKGLTELGYGNYTVTVKSSIRDAIQLAARQVRLTNRPAGLLVWRGAHSWVMSGFTATADPALTDRFTVTAVRIEDVWYPRFSTIWGHSNPPDTLVPVSALHLDYLPWKRPTGKYPGKDGNFVLVIPIA
jgi:hypothetical protein